MGGTVNSGGPSFLGPEPNNRVNEFNNSLIQDSAESHLNSMLNRVSQSSNKTALLNVQDFSRQISTLR